MQHFSGKNKGFQYRRHHPLISRFPYVRSLEDKVALLQRGTQSLSEMAGAERHRANAMQGKLDKLLLDLNTANANLETQARIIKAYQKAVGMLTETRLSAYDEIGRLKTRIEELERQRRM